MRLTTQVFVSAFKLKALALRPATRLILVLLHLHAQAHASLSRGGVVPLIDRSLCKSARCCKPRLLLNGRY